MVNDVPEQGDILYIDLDPRMGHEQQGERPVIVLSNNIVAKYTHVIIAAPISTTQRRLPLYQDLPDELNTEGTVLLDQLVTLDWKERNSEFVESVPKEYLEKLLNIVRRIFTC